MSAIDELRKGIVGDVYKSSKNNRLYYVANCCVTKGLESVFLADVDELAKSIHHTLAEYGIAGKLFCTKEVINRYPLDVLYDLDEKIDKQSLTEKQKQALEDFKQVFSPETTEFQGHYRSEEGKLK